MSRKKNFGGRLYMPPGGLHRFPQLRGTGAAPTDGATEVATESDTERTARQRQATRECALGLAEVQLRNLAVLVAELRDVIALGGTGIDPRPLLDRLARAVVELDAAVGEAAQQAGLGVLPAAH